MKCVSCGTELSGDAKFCPSCGQPVLITEPAPSQPAYSQCGSALTLGAGFCSNCGYRLSTAHVPAAPSSDAQFGRRLTSVIMVLVAVVMMLVSMAVPWYAFRYWGYTENITFGNLMESFNGGDWWGIALPAIVLVSIAGVVLITASISFTVKKNMNALWSSLGSLALMAILINAGYIVWWFNNNTGEWINIVNVGSVLVFVAVILLMVGGGIRSRHRDAG